VGKAQKIVKKIENRFSNGKLCNGRNRFGVCAVTATVVRTDVCISSTGIDPVLSLLLRRKADSLYTTMTMAALYCAHKMMQKSL
jgi:hypothetical protein